MMTNFTLEQLEYIGSSLERNVYLSACPGSGKTEVIAAKVAKEFGDWRKFPAGIAVLSFSNRATDELCDRIAKFRGKNQRQFPHFVGTIDSFFLNKIVTPVANVITGYQGQEGDYTLKVVKEEAKIFIATKYGVGKQGNIAANSFDWDLAANRFVFHGQSHAVKQLLNAVVLQPYQVQDLIDTKQRFYARGFATHKDVERLALKILGDERFGRRIGLLVERYPHIIIDECQDLSAEQIAILTFLVKRGTKLHLIGDLNQSIYGFRNSNPDSISQFIEAIKQDEISLTENFRSGQDIVDLHGKFVQAAPIIGRPNASQKNCYLLEYIQNPNEVLARFEALSVDYAKVVIVARGHSTLDKFRYAASDPSPVEILALAILIFAQGGANALQQSFNLLSSYFAKNKILSDHTADADAYYRPLILSSGLVWRQFLCDVLSTFLKEGLGDKDLEWKAWCASLKTALPRLSAIKCEDPVLLKVLSNLQSKRHPSPKNLGQISLSTSLFLKSADKCTTRLATIHEVKGETHDVTMVVSSKKRGEQSHWTEWLENATSEAARLAYVASSRPRHILILAVKSLKKDERELLLKLGFHYVAN